MRNAVVALVAAALVGTAPGVELTEVAARTGPLGMLTGFARLPADTFAEGPPSGAFLGDGRHGEARFASQPVQGFSAIAPAGDGSWWVLVDNGFGTKLNSPDARLRVYRLRPRWREASSGDGSIDVDAAFIELSDPRRLLPFDIANARAPARLLTGGDLDPESMVVAGDGSFWIGDEFGPFLLHFDRNGGLLGPPVEAEGLRSVDHPLLAPGDQVRTGTATVARSRGFEGLSSMPGSSGLLVLLEAGSSNDAPSTTAMLEFDAEQRRWTGRRWTYAFDAGAEAASEVHCYAGLRCLVIERDGRHGAAARFKRVFAVELPERGGSVEKRLVLDLLQIDDPDRLGGGGDAFQFPFVTTEAIWALDRHTLVLVNDNNFPTTGGRRDGERDPTEFIRVRLTAALP